MSAGSEKDNILRWNGKRGFYEVYYIKFNHIKSSTAYWFRYTLEVPLNGEPVAELWAVCFQPETPKIFAFKQSYPVHLIEFGKQGFYLRINDAELSHAHARGNIEQGNNHIKWDLTYTPGVSTFYHYPYLIMYKLPVPKTKVLSPNFDIRINGYVVVNGREFVCRGEPGQQSHIWGTKHAEEWVWANCNAFRDSDAIFEGLSARIKVWGFVTPPVTPLYVRFNGKDYYMNGLFLSCRNASLTNTPEWSFAGRCGRFRFDGKAWGDIKNFAGVGYVDPDGEKLWCYNTEVGSMLIRVYEREKLAGELLSEGTTALEFALRKKYPGIPVII